MPRGKGDIETLAWQQGRSRDLNLIGSSVSRGVPVITIFLTGRPLWVNAELNASDAFVIAWLPGSEGHAVADVMMAAQNGHRRYPFEGRLPMPWPTHDLNPLGRELSVSQTRLPGRV